MINKERVLIQQSLDLRILKTMGLILFSLLGGTRVGIDAAIALSPPAHRHGFTQPSTTGSDLPLALPTQLAQQLPPRPPLPSEPLPSDIPPVLPPPDELLPSEPLRSPSVSPLPDANPSHETITVFVERFEVSGNTAFSDDELAAILEPFTQRELSLSELYEARATVTRLYLDNGYVLSGAYIPPQAPNNNVVQIEVIEGRLADIEIMGHRRLRSRYIRSRLALVGDAPLKLDELVDQLRLLQLNPLIDNISGDLSAGLEPGTGILTVTVDEADSFDFDIVTTNDRTPSVGTWERGVAIVQRNLTGRGDGLSVDYTNTNGSNEINASYTIPVNSRNGTVNLSYGLTDSHVIEDPFDVLDIDSESRYYELTYRQPIVETPTETVALSLTASRQESRSLFLEDLLGEQIPFPALGADDEGRIRVSALRFAQEWVKQRPAAVLALRSQFNIGLDVFDPTINNDAPDSRFVSWEGQAQWANLLAPDTLLLLRAEAQFSGDTLVPLEQMGLGGRRTVRGYRQDLLLTDNGVLASAELQFPVYRNPKHGSVVQIIPFLDVGTGWNAAAGQTPETNTIVGTGLGLQWRQGDRFTARLDWGVPLTSLDFGFSEGTLQEDGLYFSLRYNAL
ncbi:MAG: ShlB/FhaC/HecB family hemolysin secretion/activation protein [Merismopedia sp. SIO2A8]|nr:ShlB/FhaC/HecB family hemolysin secretion/activation protein [Merismopedia sp. SIO2A8]